MELSASRKSTTDTPPLPALNSEGNFQPAVVVPSDTDPTPERSRIDCMDETFYDFESIRAGLLQGPRMTSLISVFEDIASGRKQQPRCPVLADESFLSQNTELQSFHEILQRNFGTFLRHGCASIPYLLEEIVRIGPAVRNLAASKTFNDTPFTFYETSSADGTVGRSIAEFAEGRIRTLTDSPNRANEIEFNRLCRHNYSHFYRGCFADLTPELLEIRYRDFIGGFDFIWENTTFQMYSAFREEQIAYLKRLLRHNGIMLFLEKMNHPDSNEYRRRESIKDTLFKPRYFSADQIQSKKSEIIETMELGQTTLMEFISALNCHFKYSALIWSSTNFYHIAASNDQAALECFLSLLARPHVPELFASEAPRRLSAWTR